MPYTLLPNVGHLMPNDWNIRLLTKCVTALEELDGARVSGLSRIIELFKEGFVDGCSVTNIEIDQMPLNCKGPRTIVDFLKAELYVDADKAQNDLLVYDYISAICYLIVPIGDIPGYNNTHRFILWRHSRVFSTDDVLTVKLTLSLIRTKTHASQLKKLSYKIDVRPDINEHEMNNVQEDLHSLKVFKRALDSVPDIIVFCDCDGSILGFNSAAEECFKTFINENNVFLSKGRSWIANACHPDDVKDLFNTWTEAAHENAPRKLRCRIMIEERKYRKFLCRFVPVVEKSAGSNGYWIVIATDLEIGETSDEVKSMAKMKGRFLAEISHEIRTPLACVLGTSTLLSLTKLDPDQEELLRTISVSSQQLSNLISNVLDLSKIEENKLVFERSPVLLEKCLTETLELFRTDIVRLKLEIVLEISPSVPKWVISDELRIRQIFTNLLSNAIKFSKPTSVIMIVANSVKITERSFLEINVEDEGIGISDQAGRNLFESYNQLDPSTTRKYGGSGLGLVICKRLVELLGGTIGFKSEGTTFTVQLPCEEASDLQISSVATKTNFQSLGECIFCTQTHLQDYKQSNPVSIELNLIYPKVCDHIKRVLDRIPTLKVRVIASPNDEQEFRQGTDIILTDRIEIASSNIGEILGLLFLSYDLYGPFKSYPFVMILKKPAKISSIIVAVDRLIAQMFPKFEADLIKPPASPLKLIDNYNSNENLSARYPLKILVAEDDELNQKLLVRVLDRFGYKNLEIANDGAEALNIIRMRAQKQESIEVVFMDMQMPNIDGCTASKIVRSEGFQCHIIAMTANAFREDKEACLQSGMCDYASKPVKWETLKSLLIRAFDATSGACDCECRNLADIKSCQKVMSIRKLPSDVLVSQLSRSDRFLYEISRGLELHGKILESPVVQFMAAVRAYYADGCALVLLDNGVNRETWLGNKTVIEWIDKELGEIKDDFPETSTIIGYMKDECISLLLKKHPWSFRKGSGVPFLLVWRSKGLFDSHDLVILDAALGLLRGKFDNSWGRSSPARVPYFGLCPEAAEEVQELHELVKTALDSVHELAFICTKNGTLHWVNNHASDLLNVIPEQRIEHDDFRWLVQLVHLDDIEGAIKKIMQTIESSTSCNLSMRFLVAYSRYRTFHCRVSPLSMTIDKSPKWILTAADSKEGETIELDNISMSQCISALIQDLRIPLAFSMATLSSIKRITESKEIKDHLEVLNGSLLQMNASLANALLMTEKSEEFFLPSFSMICLEELVDCAIQSRAEELETKDVEVLVVISTKLPRYVRADEVRVRQLLVNLLSYASKRANPKTSITITVEKKLEVAGMEVLLRTDFEDRGQSAKKEQAAIELAIVKKLAGLTGGTLIEDRNHPKAVPNSIVRHICNDLSVCLQIFLPVSEGSQITANSDYITREVAIDSLNKFLDSLSRSKPIEAYVCSNVIKIGEHLIELLNRVHGIQVTRANLEEVKINSDKGIIIIFDSLDSNVAIWIRKHLDDDLSPKRVRFICLKEAKVEYSARDLSIFVLARPFLDSTFIRAFHEAVIRLSITVESAQNPLHTCEMPSNIAEKFPMRIMVAEDSLLNLQVLIKTLNKMGFSDVLLAHDGQEAVETFISQFQHKHRVDLVFMDMQMPVLDGCGASLKIRDFIHNHSTTGMHGPHIVAMTADSFQEDKQACLRSGMCRFTSKPVQWGLLEQLLSEGYAALNGRRTCRCQSPALGSW